MFADTDFILALLKDSDWLKKNALSLLHQHGGQISTSVSVMIEVALVCKRLKLDVPEVFANAFELIQIDDKDYSTCMRASAYIGKHNVNVFDSFHAAYCSSDAIISSDNVYETLGIKMVRLGHVSENL